MKHRASHPAVIHMRASEDLKHPRARTGSCVLTFHRIVSRCDLDHDVSWTTFREFLGLVDRTGLPCQADLDRPDAHGQTLVLTFDDGTDDHLHVGEELHDRRIGAIFFVTAGRLGEPHYLSASRLGELVSQGHTIGSHSFDHIPLRDLSEHRLRDQLVRSKAFLEDALGMPIKYFAPPGGIPNALLTPELVNAGYSACRSMKWDFYRSFDQRLWVPCLPITELTYRLWLDRALTSWRVPRTMHAAWFLKNLLPHQAALRARHWIHTPRVSNGQ
jgi:peptidoglycan/xylan/chitin deacetylase (PgdA/CDA1 family)